MALLDFLRKGNGQSDLDVAVGRFYAARPEWKPYLERIAGADFLQRYMFGMHVAQPVPTEREMLDFLQGHPHWRLVDDSVVKRLIRRISAPPFTSVAYNYADGFRVLVTLAEKYKVVQTNLLQICRNPAGPEFGTPEAKLWLLAFTFQQLATRFMREAHAMSASAGRGNLPEISQKHADAMAATEACLTVNPRFHTAYTLLPFLWVSDESTFTCAFGACEHQVRRTQPHLTGKALEQVQHARFSQWLDGRFQRANAICDEAERVCKHLSEQGERLPCIHDRGMALKAHEGIAQIRVIRKDLLNMRAQWEGDSGSRKRVRDR